jgi:curli biogenesis system outer membrane secretion channel CsgG
MGNLLASQVAAHLEAAPGFRVVERQALVKALEELNLGSSELTDDQTRLRLGHIIGARQMIFGAFQQFGGALRVDLRRVDVSSGKILKTATATTTVTGAGGLLDAADLAAQTITAP